MVVDEPALSPERVGPVEDLGELCCLLVELPVLVCEGADLVVEVGVGSLAVGDLDCEAINLGPELDSTTKEGQP